MSLSPSSPLSLDVVPEKALRRWAAERLRRSPRVDGGTLYEFAMSGSTCGNVPIDVLLTVAVDAEGRIESASSAPARGDRGCEAMCAVQYAAQCDPQRDARRFLAEHGGCDDVIGLTLHEAAARDWQPEPSGCFCTAGNRRHKWRNVFQTLYYAVTHEMRAAG